MLANEIHKELLRLLETDFKCYETLPMAVYITANDGTILSANKKAKVLFELAEDDVGTSNIIPHYFDVRDREAVIRRIKKTKPGEWIENETLQFWIGEGEARAKHSFRYFSKPCFTDVNDPESWIGSISLIFEISEIERFRNLDELMPIGNFEVTGAEMGVVYRNKKFNELLWVDQPSDQKLQASAFFIDQGEFNSLRQKLEEGQTIKDEVVRLKRLNNHSNILASLNIVPEVYEDGAGNKKLIGCKGFIQDITFSSFLDAPIGLYVVMRNTAGEEIITWANHEFANISGFRSTKDCLGTKVIDVYREEDHHVYHAFLDAFNKQAKAKKYLVDYWLEFIHKNGQLKQFFVHAKAIYSKENGDVIGRVGSVIDLSDNIKQQLLKEVENDYAAFLHMYSAFIHDLQTTLISVIRGHSSDAVKNLYDVDVAKAFFSVQQAVKRLAVLLNEFLEEAIQRRFIKDVFRDNINRVLHELTAALPNGERHTNLTSKAKALEVRQHLLDIRKLLNAVPSLRTAMPSRLRKDIEQQLTEGLRFARLVSLWQLFVQSEGMSADLDILRAILSPQDDEGDDQIAECEIEDVLNDVKDELAEYAKNERVTIRISMPNKKLTVLAVPRNLHSAFYNLLHNAVKYTWKKPSMMESYVSVTVSESERIAGNKPSRYLSIAFTNRGDAIMDEELKNKKIFQFGYRGVLALNGRKKGTGVGLWHAKKLIKALNGNIDVVSQPIVEQNSGSANRDYSLPFLTTITVELPTKK